MLEITGEMHVLTDEDLAREEARAAEEPAVVPGQPLHRKTPLWRRIFGGRWAVPLVFTMAAFLTVLGGYGLGQLNQEPAKSEVVQEFHPTRDISDETAKDLLQEATTAADLLAQEKAEEAANSTETTISETKAALEARLKILEDELAAEEKTNEELVQQVADLQELLTLLTERLETLEEAAQTPSGNSNEPTAPAPEDGTP